MICWNICIFMQILHSPVVFIKNTYTSCVFMQLSCCCNYQCGSSTIQKWQFNRLRWLSKSEWRKMWLWPFDRPGIFMHEFTQSGMTKRSEENGQTRGLTVTQTTTPYNRDEQKSVVECITYGTMKQIGYYRRRPHWLPFQSAMNRNMRLHWAQTHLKLGSWRYEKQQATVKIQNCRTSAVSEILLKKTCHGQSH